MNAQKDWLSLLAAAAVVAINPCSAAAVVILSGDGNVVDRLVGSTIDSGNQQFFINVLQGRTKVGVLRNTFPMCCESFDENISTFYNSQPGVTATTIVGAVTPASLSGIDLFVSPIPDDAFSDSEISALNGLLSAGGSIFFLGENRYFTSYNSYINSALAALGIGMSISVDSSESGFATVVGADIASSPYAAGVTTFSYAAPSTVVGGNTLFYNVNHLPFIAFVETVPEPSAAVLALLAASLGSTFVRRCPRRTV